MTEPATTLTDYAITLETLLFAVGLWRWGWSARCWALAFVCVGLAAALGGTYHGFGTGLSHAQQVWLWQGTVIFLAWASFWPLVAAAESCPWGLRWILLAIASAKLVLSLAFTASSWGFGIRAIDYLGTLGLVVVIYGWLAWRKQGAGLAWMATGLAVSLVAIAVLAMPRLPWVSLSPMAAYHLVQMVGLYCLYRGVCGHARAVGWRQT
jgi:hypothetical protein